MHPTNYHEDSFDEVSFKFGSINTTLPVLDGFAGKTLYLEISSEEMQEVYRLYACGLFL